MKKLAIFGLCLALGSFALAGCSGEGEAFEEKDYTPDAQIKEISLDVRDKEIEVRLSEDEQVHIRYFESSKEYYDISVSDGGVLTMVDADSKEWTDYIGKKPSAEKSTEEQLKEKEEEIRRLRAMVNESRQQNAASDQAQQTSSSAQTQQDIAQENPSDGDSFQNQQRKNR